VGIFKRRRKDDRPAGDTDALGSGVDEAADSETELNSEAATGRVLDEPIRSGGGAHAAPDDGGPSGPFDEHDAPDDEMPRLDLGSIRIPVPEGAQLQVEMEPEGPLRAVHLVTPIGQFTVSAFAAPRSGDLWSEIRAELADQLRTDGATVGHDTGEWGEELTGAVDDMALRFVGVDGPRWMLRGVVAGPPEHAEYAQSLLRDIVRSTVVVRGDQPYPVRSPLPVELPQELAEHIEQARAEEEA
jgi:hypothetical protein